MCFNLAVLRIQLEDLSDRYAALMKDLPAPASLPESLPVFYFVSGFSHPVLPVLTAGGFIMAAWGLIPAWVKDHASARDIRSKTLNAVGETVFEKPSFRKAAAAHRCLVPVTGFYEWRDHQGKKYPYFISDAGGRLLSLGGIYEHWADKESGELITSFSIITTPANPLLEKIHNLKKRMPLIIGEENEKNWIDPKLSRTEVEKIIRPWQETNLSAYTISRSANSSAYDRDFPGILDPVNYPELPPL